MRGPSRGALKTYNVYQYQYHSHGIFCEDRRTHKSLRLESPTKGQTSGREHKARLVLAAELWHCLILPCYKQLITRSAGLFLQASTKGPAEVGIRTLTDKQRPHYRPSAMNHLQAGAMGYI